VLMYLRRWCAAVLKKLNRLSHETVGFETHETANFETERRISLFCLSRSAYEVIMSLSGEERQDGIGLAQNNAKLNNGF